MHLHQIIANELGLSESHIRKLYRDSGATDKESFIVWYRSEYQSDDKKRKLKAEADRTESLALKAKLEVEQMQGSLVSLEEIETAQTKIAALVRTRLVALQSELPTRLEGKNPEEMTEIIATAIEQILTSED